MKTNLLKQTLVQLIQLKRILFCKHNAAVRYPAVFLCWKAGEIWGSEQDRNGSYFYAKIYQERNFRWKQLFPHAYPQA